MLNDLVSSGKVFLLVNYVVRSEIADIFQSMIQQLLLFISLVPFASLAANNTNLFVKGTVAPKLSVEVIPTTQAANLNLQQSMTDLKVARGSVVSNSPTGFKVLVSSENAGNLKRIGGAALFPYTMKFGGMSIPLLKTPTEFLSSDRIDTSGDLTVSYLGKPLAQMEAGEYQDTIRFTIQSR